MEINKVKKIVNVIHVNNPSYRGDRLISSYRDLLAICSVYKELEDELEDIELHDDSGGEKWNNISLSLNRSEQIKSLLKASYTLGNICINAVIGEAVEESSYSMNQLVHSPIGLLTSLSPSEILPAYCVAMYRHKIVVHHNFRRITGVNSREEGLKLLPLGDGIEIEEEQKEKIDELTNKYIDKIKPLSKGNNYYKKLEGIFYNVPLGRIGSLQKDRKRVNEIAEKGGCRSMSLKEIIEAIDMLIYEIARTLLNNETAA
jgi:hypothetical protein